MFQVILENRAEKELKRLDKRFIPKVLSYLRVLKTNPLVGIKMEGSFKGLYKIKIPPPRIIYQPDFKNKIIYIRTIGFRGGIYKK